MIVRTQKFSTARLSLHLCLSSVLVAAACFSAGASAKSTIVFASYGGDYQEAQSKAFVEGFQALHPDITVVQDSPSSDTKLKAMVEAGRVSWDVVLLANDFGNDIQEKWLEPIDYSIIDKNKIVPGYAGTYRVGADIEGTVIAYRKDKFSATPETWQDFFDLEKFPGKRAVNKFAGGGILEAALLADGIAPKDLYPLDVDRALRKLDTIKSSIVWWSTSAESQQLLESGETSMGLVWVGRADQAGKVAPVVVNWDTWLSQDGFLVVPKGTKMKKEAMMFIDYATSEAAQKKFSELQVYGPTNVAAAEDPAVKNNPNRPTNHLATQVKTDDNWYAEYLPSVTKKFNSWLLQ